MSLGPASLPSIITMLFNLLIGLLIYRRNPSSRSAFSFLLLTSTFALWLGSAAAQRATDGGLAIFFNQAQYAGVSLIITAFTYFSYEFLIESKTILDNKYLRWTIYLSGIILTLLSFTGLLITNDVQKGTYDILGAKYTVYHGGFGPAYLVFVFVFIIGIILNLFAYLQSLTSERSKNRKKGIILILIGLILVGSMGSITDVLLPLIGINLPLADVLTIIETAFIAVAMVRYKVFAIGKSALYHGSGSKETEIQGPIIIVPTTKKNEHINLFNDLLKTGNWGVVITSRGQEDIRDSFVNVNIPILWVTDEDVDPPHLNPTQLYEIGDALNLFLKSTPKCIILLDQPDKYFGKSMTSSENIWDLLTYFKELEDFVKKNNGILIIPKQQSNDITEEADKSIITVQNDSWLYLPSFLGLVQRIGILQPLMEKYSNDEQENLSQNIKSQTKGKFEVKKKNNTWFLEGPSPKDKNDLVSVLRILFSCTKLIGKEEVTSILRSLIRSVEIKDAELLFHPGGSYIILDKSRSKAFQYLNELGEISPSLCMTKHSPDKIRRNFNIPKNCDIVWLSRNPNDIEPENGLGRAIKTDLEYVYLEISNFMEKGTHGIILMDVFEYLYSQNGFGPLLRVFEKIVDRIATTEHIFLLSVNPDFVKPDELILLEKLMEKS